MPDAAQVFNLTETVIEGLKRTQSQNMQVTEFAETCKLSTYVFSIVAGDYEIH